jgi:uncharacterized small protein (DUF1192 family)
MMLASLARPMWGGSDQASFFIRRRSSFLEMMMIISPLGNLGRLLLERDAKVLGDDGLELFGVDGLSLLLEGDANVLGDDGLELFGVDGLSLLIEGDAKVLGNDGLELFGVDGFAEEVVHADAHALLLHLRTGSTTSTACIPQ